MKLYIILATLMLLMVIPMTTAQTVITGCGNYNVSGTYVLNADLNITGSSTFNDVNVNTCIGLTGSDMIFDGQGYKMFIEEYQLNGNNINSAVAVGFDFSGGADFDNVTVRNVEIDGGGFYLTAGIYATSWGFPGFEVNTWTNTRIEHTIIYNLNQTSTGTSQACINIDRISSTYNNTLYDCGYNGLRQSTFTFSNMDNHNATGNTIYNVINGINFGRGTGQDIYYNNVSSETVPLNAGHGTRIGNTIINTNRSWIGSSVTFDSTSGGRLTDKDNYYNISGYFSFGTIGGGGSGNDNWWNIYGSNVYAENKTIRVAESGTARANVRLIDRNFSDFNWIFIDFEEIAEAFTHTIKVIGPLENPWEGAIINFSDVLGDDTNPAFDRELDWNGFTNSTGEYQTFLDYNIINNTFGNNTANPHTLNVTTGVFPVITVDFNVTNATSQTVQLGGFIENSNTFNAEAIETSLQEFQINITYASVLFDFITADLNYNGQTTAGTRTGTGDNVVFDATVTAPLYVENFSVLPYEDFSSGLLQNLTGYYKLDGTTGPVVDATGNNDGGILGGTVRGVTGALNTGFSFDGIDTASPMRVNISNDGSAFYDQNSFTLNAWAKSVGDVENAGIGNMIDRRLTSADASSPYYLHWRDTTDEVVIHLTNVSAQEVSVVSSPLNRNQFYMITATFDEATGNLSLYINGELNASALTGYTLVNSDTERIYIGGAAFATKQTFNGTIDEVGLWTRALSSDQVEDLYQSSNLKDFFWEVKLTKGTNETFINSSTQMQEITPLNLQDCSAGGTVLMNFTAARESNLSEIKPFQFEGTFTYSATAGGQTKTLNIPSQSVDSKAICLGEPEIGEIIINSAQIKYDGTTVGEFVERDYFIQNQTFTNTTTTDIVLFLLESADSTSFILKVQDQNIVPITDALILVERFYPGLNEFRTVQVARTDDDGKSVAFYQTETVDYRHTITKNGESLLVTTPQKIVGEEAPFTLTFTVGEIITAPLETFEDVENLDATLLYNATTKIVTFTYEDLSGNLTLAQLLVQKVNAGTLNTVLCQVNATTQSGILTCDLSSEGEGTFIAQAFIERSPEQLVKAIQFLITDNAGIFGTTGLFLAWFLILAAFMIGIWNPTVGIIMGDMMIILVNLIGIAVFPPIFIFGAIGVSIIVLILLKT